MILSENLKEVINDLNSCILIIDDLTLELKNLTCISNIIYRLEAITQRMQKNETN